MYSSSFIGSTCGYLSAIGSLLPGVIMRAGTEKRQREVKIVVA